MTQIKQVFAKALQDQRQADHAAGEMLQVLHELSESLGNAVDAKDHHTRVHSEQVANIAFCLARRLRLPRQQCIQIHIAGHLHDVGKIGVPDVVLGKPGKLSPHEMYAIRQHPAIGANILAPVCRLEMSSDIRGMVLHHHEYWDGGGYPNGLHGEAIPLGARIISLADAYSAMRENRAYRRGLAQQEALDRIEKAAGSQFDPEVAVVLLDMLSEQSQLLPEPLRNGVLPATTLAAEGVAV